MNKTLVLMVVLLTCCWCNREECSRDLSRVVRRLTKKELHPILEEYNLAFAPGCLLSPERDLYNDQETHGKHSESGSKWVCQYCGKAFYDEKWLDRHFDNRHPEMLKQGSWLTCLAEYCDIFRCDVIQGHNTAKYWDVALCRDNDLLRVKRKCQELVTSCVPENLSPQQMKMITEKLNSALCSYLNCDNYWELPPSEVSPIGKATYTIAFILLLFALMLYYLVVYAHFYLKWCV